MRREQLASFLTDVLGFAMPDDVRAGAAKCDQKQNREHCDTDSKDVSQSKELTS